MWSGKKDSPNNFLIGVGIRNKGAEDAEQVTLLVSITPNNNNFKIEDGKKGVKKNIPLIKGRSLENFDGEFIPIYFDAESIGIRENEEEKIFNVEAKVYYKYKTVASADICVDPNMPDFFDIRKNTCKSNKISSLSQGQGAPIIISKVEEAIEPKTGYNNLILRIFLEDKGDKDHGERIANFDTCDNSDLIEIEDISFSDYSLLNDKIHCEGLIDGNKVRFYRKNIKETAIICWAELERDTNIYNTPLIIKLKYGYQTSTIKSINVKNLEYEINKVRVSKFKVVPYALPIPENNEQLMEKIEIMKKKKSGKGDFRNLLIPKSIYPAGINPEPTSDQVRKIIFDYLGSKGFIKNSAINKIGDCYFREMLPKESQGYKQFRDKGRYWQIVASGDLEKKEKTAYGCCVGIAQVNVNFYDKDNLDTAYRLITYPILNIQKGVDIFLNHIQNENGNLEKASYEYSGNWYSVCKNKKLDNNEKWWPPKLNLV